MVRSRASSIPKSPLHGGGPDRIGGAASTWRSISRFRTPSRQTCRRWRGSGINIVIGTTGWAARRSRRPSGSRRRGHRGRGGAEFFGRRRDVRSDRGPRGGAVRGAAPSSAHSCTKRITPRRRMRRRAPHCCSSGRCRTPATRGRSTCRRRAPAMFREPTRSASTARPKRSSLSHTARDRSALRAGRAAAARSGYRAGAAGSR